MQSIIIPASICAILSHQIVMISLTASDTVLDQQKCSKNDWEIALFHRIGDDEPSQRFEYDIILRETDGPIVK